MTDAVVLTALTVERSGRGIVHDVSMTIATGSWFGVIGANGSGKTTLLRAIAGRLAIASGECALFSVECAGERSIRAEAIGFAPPIDHLPGVLTVGKLLQLAGDPIEVQQQRNSALWQSLGIADLLTMPISECSSGMRQRAALAIAFALPTRIVILDEPFNWLDPVAAYDTRVALAAMVASGLTLITALHDFTTLCGFCDDAIVMANGRVNLHLSQAALHAGRNDAARFESELVAALR